MRVRSDQHALRLDSDGYFRLNGFLSPDEVASAEQVFHEAWAMYGEPIGASWFPTILLQNDDVRTFITEGLTRIIGPKLHTVFDVDSLDVVRLDYSVKPASSGSELGPHQDYALVDEQEAESLYLWIPLCDTGDANGTLHVVPGSHHFSNRIRSRHVPSVFDDVIDQVKDAGVRLDCRAGDLVVMVSGVVHYSPANRTDELRLAAHGIVKPAGVPLVFYFADDETPPGKVECYELDIERYVRGIHEGRPRPSAEMDRLVDRPPSSMSPQRFAQGMADLGSLQGDDAP